MTTPLPKNIKNDYIKRRMDTKQFKWKNKLIGSNYCDTIGVLGDEDIKRYINIDPFDENNVNPASYDCTLNSKFLSLNKDIKTIDPFDKDTIKYDTIFSDTYLMKPDEFLLGSTNEIIDLKNIKHKNLFVVGEVSGKSSLARLGLEIHMTAGFIDPGFIGRITIELKNNSGKNFLLSYNMKICQIKFSTVKYVKTLYCHKMNSKYINQTMTTGSKYYLNKR